MEDASNGKVEEALQKVEEALKEDAELVVDSVKELVKNLVDGDSQPAAKEAEDREDSRSSSSSSDGEKEEDPREEIDNPGHVVTVEEAVEEVSENVVDSTVAESEQGGYLEKTVEVKEEEETVVASSEAASGVEEVVAEQISETALTAQEETNAVPAPTGLVLPVEEESKGDLTPEGGNDLPQQPPENVSAAEQIAESTVNPVSATDLMVCFRD